jgi:tagatose-6-phosphate ketose/aldose isomerase
MNTYLGMNEEELQSSDAYFTAKEISGQPELWLNTYELIQSRKAEIKLFLNRCFGLDNLEVILSGAGTSAFIGDVLEGPFQLKTGVHTRAVATTDLVTHPEQYLCRDNPILLISFARSGNSPESLAVVDLANQLIKNIYHLVITCNPNGALAQKLCDDNCFVFILPPEADDQSLAMTGSFSSMLLTCLLFSQIDKIDYHREAVKKLSRAGKIILSDYLHDIINISKKNFDRAVFLGSGPYRGIARESHLKLQELTDGQVICKHDSFLGFRHGPKAVITPQTFIVFLLSNNNYVHQYERDLIKSINSGERGLARIGVGNRIIPDFELDLEISFDGNLADEFNSIASVLPAQMLGFFKSLALGLKPDTPSVSGTITRVVQGVTIYPRVKNEILI